MNEVKKVKKVNVRSEFVPLIFYYFKASQQLENFFTIFFELGGRVHIRIGLIDERNINSHRSPG